MEEFELLREGVPSWLRQSLVQRIKKLVGVRNSWASWSDWDSEIRARIEASLHREIPDSVSDFTDDDCLDVINYILCQTDICQPADVDYLEARLSEGGSVWRATPLGLERRVDETLQSVADAVFVTNDRPADYLKSAWHKAWGRNPDASGAHQDAGSATEAAYAPIVSPDNDRATLGTIIGNIRAKPPKYQVRLQTKTAELDVCRIVDMMELLWESQRCHGTDDRSRETIEEARDAVAIATTLVHLAQQGGFTANGS